ncbi:sugar-phosphate:phosphate dmt family [Nannochloropsis oceanica]
MSVSRHRYLIILVVLALFVGLLPSTAATSSSSPSSPSSSLRGLSVPASFVQGDNKMSAHEDLEAAAKDSLLPVMTIQAMHHRTRAIPSPALHNDQQPEEDMALDVSLLSPSSPSDPITAVTTSNRIKLRQARGGGAVPLTKGRRGIRDGKGTMIGTPLRGTLITLGYFALWFALNVYYNIVNKQVLNTFPLPFTVATAQLGIGAIYVSLSWLLRLRAAPQTGKDGLKDLLPIALFHGSGQLFTVLSLGAAAVSFTHIVKALEPFFSALVAALCFKQILKPQVYLSLVPVVLGVAVACANDVSFGWLAFLTAMASNLAFALRANFSKSTLAVFKREGNDSMSPANVYGVITILAFILLLPLTLLWEGVDLQPSWRVATEKLETSTLTYQLLLSGLFHYLNNEVMYLALDSVHPITLAVGNTAKRVFIIVASLIAFRNPISMTGAVGSAVGIAGVLVYTLTKQYYDTHV